MPDSPAVPTVDDQVVRCGKCPREFLSYRWRIMKVFDGEARVMVDRDGLVIYDLVLVCSCGTVFHHHTKEETLKKHAQVYQSALSAFEILMKHYQPRPVESAIINADKPSG